MTTTPDPQRVREIARDCVADYIDDARDIAAHVMGHFGMGVPGDVYAWTDAVRTDLRAAVVSWPDDGAAGRDGYAVRLLDMLDADPDRLEESEEEDLRAALSALFRCTAEAANLATALAEAQAERDGGVQAVAEAVSILEGMLNEDAWAYDAGRARNVLLDYFARDLDALEARDTKAGE